MAPDSLPEKWCKTAPFLALMNWVFFVHSVSGPLTVLRNTVVPPSDLHQT